MRNKELAKLIARIHEESRGTYGWPRVRAGLVPGLGETVNRKRAGRLMRQAGLQGIHRRKGRKNLVSAATGEDLVHRQFTAGGLDRLRLTGITGHPTAEGKVYCAAVMDACSRRITGWSIDSSQKTELVAGAIGMAILRRRPQADSTILHSGHGTQYTSRAFGKRLREAGLLGSMGTAGDCCDNSMMESFWGTMQIELPGRKAWKSRKELANAIFEWMECWYNPKRRHSSLGMLSPADYETRLRPPDHGA